MYWSLFSQTNKKLQAVTGRETMGKHGKKQSHQRGTRRTFSYNLEESCEEERYPPLNPEEGNVSDEEGNDSEAEEDEEDSEVKNNLPSKFWLYQQSVQVKF